MLFEAVERVQKGISNRVYPGGLMCERFEETIHRFQNMVIDRMVGIDRVPEGDREHTYFGSQALKKGDDHVQQSL